MEKEPLLLSGLQHFAFCPRQWALIHIEQQWEENVLTAQGRVIHERAHSGGAASDQKGTIITRGMQIFSRAMNVSGACDVVEFRPNEAGVPLNGHRGLYLPYPIEYKRGSPKENDCDRLQLCAQAMCLAEMLACDVPEGALFYHEIRRRDEVAFDDALRERVRSLFLQMQEYTDRGYTPRVRKNRRCQSCSLKEQCLPGMPMSENASAYLTRRLQEEDGV